MESSRCNLCLKKANTFNSLSCDHNYAKIAIISFVFTTRLRSKSTPMISIRKFISNA